MYAGSLEWVRDQFGLSMSVTGAEWPRERHLEVFDAALAEHDAEVVRQAKVEALREAGVGWDEALRSKAYDSAHVEAYLNDCADRIAGGDQG